MHCGYDLKEDADDCDQCVIVYNKDENTRCMSNDTIHNIVKLLKTLLQ